MFGTWLLIAATAAVYNAAAAEDLNSESPSNLESFRRNSDLQSQRRHVWKVIAQLTRTDNRAGEPRFQDWYGEDAVFATDSTVSASRGIWSFSRVSAADADSPNSDTAASSGGAASAETPVLTYTLYNEPAYRHIREHRLYLRSKLRHFAETGAEDRTVPGNRTIPAFPRQAIVLKTAWWPVARDGLTVLPVWDPEGNPVRGGGNDYTTWQRVVAVDPSTAALGVQPTRVDFAGASFSDARRVALQSFYHVRVTAGLASSLARDHSAEKLALIVLGRPVQEGDFLVLVGANLATKEISDWVWAALWWHDRNVEGPYAAQRPRDVDGVWSQYLMQVAFDSQTPTAGDDGPHICFNPWLEARFPDGGHGGGTLSNCLACHRRASYPPANFLPVSRGLPDLSHDPAFAPTQLRTNFNWSLALHAKP